MKRERKLRLCNEHGFTLIESTLVVIVVGLIAIIAVPKLLSTDKREVYIAAHQITADMRHARGLAIANAATDDDPYIVRFYPKGGGSSYYGSYVILAPDDSTVKSMEIPDEVDCDIPTGVGNWDISFNGLGSASVGGDIMTLDKAGSYTQSINVISATGRISIDEP
ncbi:Tfp pilus assembly protein FimT/FimU [Candidatus Poribacteria bacterium]